MSLAAERLTFGYPGHRVGADADLSVEPGRVMVLLGPNGGGKTTLLKTLLGLMPPLAGRVMLDGRDLGTIAVGARARAIGYVPQSGASPFAFSVGDVVLMGRTAHGGLFAAPTRRDRDIAAAVLDRLGIAHLSDRPTTMISGGERQLVLIARALAQEPRFIVLDEPTASLDFGNQGQVLRQVRRLAADGLGVLFTTHDPNHAGRVADRVVMLRDGRLMADGPARAVLSSDALAALYGAPVETLTTDDGRTAYRPG